MKKLLLLAMIMPVLGCLERRENLMISFNGAVEVEWQVKGDENDVREGLQLPSQQPWQISETRHRKDQKEEYVYIAKSKFAGVEEYNKAIRFAPQDLQMENHLSIEKRGNKTYYCFKRLYHARNWKKFELARDREIDKDLEKRLSQKGFVALSPIEKKKLLTGIANFEIKKRLILASDALGKALMDCNFSSELIDVALEKMEKMYCELITTDKLEKLLSLEGDEQNRQLETMKKSLSVTEHTILHEVFEKHPQIDVSKYLNDTTLEYQLSEDLQDENFTVKLIMPGKIIITNGVKTAPNEVLWEFNGKDLINRHIPLEVISVLEE